MFFILSRGIQSVVPAQIRTKFWAQPVAISPIKIEWVMVKYGHQLKLAIGDDESWHQGHFPPGIPQLAKGIDVAPKILFWHEHRQCNLVFQLLADLPVPQQGLSHTVAIHGKIQHFKFLMLIADDVGPCSFLRKPTAVAKGFSKYQYTGATGGYGPRHVRSRPRTQIVGLPPAVSGRDVFLVHVTDHRVESKGSPKIPRRNLFAVNDYISERRDWVLEWTWL